uniref:Homeobox protein 2-like n=1 Tax=Rhabditophanes sp. KR3021 TaxID=114890 RepID=A0AC35TRL8_9BILA
MTTRNDAAGKVRSLEQEAALDAKIALIRQRNKQIEERNKVVAIDKATSLGMDALAIADKETKGPSLQKSSKPKDKRRSWDREWDAGKTKAEDWKTNVPTIDDSTCFTKRQLAFENKGGRKNSNCKQIFEINAGQDGNSSNNNNNPNNNNVPTGATKEGEGQSSGSSKENSRVKKGKSLGNAKVSAVIKEDEPVLPPAFKGPLGSRLAKVLPGQTTKEDKKSLNKKCNNQSLSKFFPLVNITFY